MKKLGKKNEMSFETVEAFTCFCLRCSCVDLCYCPDILSPKFITSKSYDITVNTSTSNRISSTR